MYRVFRQLENGEFVHVASREELEQAVQLVEKLNTHWPGEYAVRNSQGNDVDLAEREVVLRRVGIASSLDGTRPTPDKSANRKSPA